MNVDIDMDDLLWSMSTKEKQQLVDELYDDGYTPASLQGELDKHVDDLSIACKKLMGEGWRLTTEEVEIIINISKRF